MSKGKIFLRRMVICAMLVAVGVVLDRFVPIAFTDSLKISLAFIPVLVAASLFGPVDAAVVWALIDLIGALLFPRGIYFPGFTVTCALKGFLFGFCMTRFKNFLMRAALPAFISNFIISLFLDTWFISILYSSNTYWGYVVVRLPQFIILFCLNIILVPLLDEINIKLKKALKTPLK